MKQKIPFVKERNSNWHACFSERTLIIPYWGKWGVFLTQTSEKRFLDDLLMLLLRQIATFIVYVYKHSLTNMIPLIVGTLIERVSHILTKVSITGWRSLTTRANSVRYFVNQSFLFWRWKEAGKTNKTNSILYSICSSRKNVFAGV